MKAPARAAHARTPQAAKCGAPRADHASPKLGPANQVLQCELRVGRADDPLEREADRIADRVIGGESGPAISATPAPAAIGRACAACAAEKDAEAIRMKEASTGAPGGSAVPSGTARAASAVAPPGTPLPSDLRAYFEPRFGRDFSNVRLHLDAASSAAAEGINARAYTLGPDIAFAPGHYAPDSESGRRLIAHELAHVAQQASAAPIPASAPDAPRIDTTQQSEPMLQRRLLMDGDAEDVDGLIDFIEPPSGLLLFHNPLSAEVDITGAAPGTPRSPSLASELTRVVSSQQQDAEIHVGQGQARVLVGAFPQPSDLTQGRVQRIDLDDVRALEAGAPGNGVAAVAHEIEENFQAHGVTPIPGVDRFDVAHERAIESESDVSEELVGPGRRVARRILQDNTVIPSRTTFSIDYQNYYLVIEAVDDPATRNVTISRSIQAARVVVSQRTIDRFGFNAVGVPSGGQSELAAAVTDVQANELSTITIEGHADSIGGDDVNVAVSTKRAEQTREAMINAGVEAGREKERFHIVGRGEAEPVSDNDTPEGRAQNRRVVITVSRPIVDIPAFL